MIEQEINRGRERPPRLGLGFERRASSFRQLIEFRPAVVLGGAPFRLYPPTALEPMERRIERPLLDSQRVAGELLNALGNRPSVLGTEADGLQDQQIKRALRKIHAPLSLRQENRSVPVEVQGHGLERPTSRS